MKGSIIKFIVGLFFFIGISFALDAQDHWCGFHPSENAVNRLKANKEYLKQNPISNQREFIYVPLTFILTADDNGNGRAREEQVLDQIAGINSFYEDQEILFYLDEIKYADKSVIYENQYQNSSNINMNIQKDFNAISIFVAKNAQSTPEQNESGTTLGYYSINNDWLVIRKDELNSLNATLAHEIGHFFSLLHPFNGWDFTPWNLEDHGNPVTQTIAPGPSLSPGFPPVLVELVERTNCDDAGDYLCDTPADYLFTSANPPVGQGCGQTISVKDKNDDLLVPDKQNVMSYYDCAPLSFTPTQKDLIVADYNSFERFYIRTGVIPETTPVEGPANLLFPIDGESSNGHLDVNLDWDDVPGANRYLVIVDRLSSFGFNPIRMFVDDSEAVIPELEEDRTYYWKVWPFNESQTGAGWSATGKFRSDFASAVKEIKGVSKFDVYPNPTNGSEQIILSLNANRVIEADVNLVDVNGKTVISRGNITFDQEVNNKIDMSVSGLAPGIYFLNLLSDDGVLTKKIFVD